MMKWCTSFFVVLGLFSANAYSQSPDVQVSFPLGQVPAGWTYQPLGEFERQIEALPFEVRGTLERPFGEQKVFVYLVMIPARAGSQRLASQQWTWLENVFVPAGIAPAKSYELSSQQSVGSKRRWSYREVTITRAGIPMNLAAFRVSQRYHDVFLVLREEENVFRAQLPQLKDLVRDLKLD